MMKGLKTQQNGRQESYKLRRKEQLILHHLDGLIPKICQTSKIQLH